MAIHIMIEHACLTLSFMIMPLYGFGAIDSVGISMYTILSGVRSSNVVNSVECLAPTMLLKWTVLCCGLYSPYAGSTTAGRPVEDDYYSSRPLSLLAAFDVSVLGCLAIWLSRRERRNRAAWRELGSM